MLPSTRIIPRRAPFFIRFLGAIGVIILIAIVAWWYYGRQAAMVDEIFREASSLRVLPEQRLPTPTDFAVQGAERPG